jgi:hypothetical protein
VRTRLAPGQYLALWSRIVEIDEEITRVHAEGYCTDGLLEDRLKAQVDWEQRTPSA